MVQVTEEKVKKTEEGFSLQTPHMPEGKRQAMEIAEEARAQEYELPSFGRKLFMGEFDPTMLFPFPEQPEDDKKEADLFIRDLESFLVRELDPDEVDTTRTIPDKVIKGLAQRGAFAIKIPEKYEGLGFSQTNYLRIVMKVASYCGSTAVLLSAHQSIGVPQPLKMFGTEAQKQKYFPKFRAGAISAFALTEPDVGSDPARLTTTATLSDDGAHYILNGTKLWCTNGTIANIIIVIAQTAPKIVRGKEKKQISAFILEMNTPGVEVVHRCEFMGLGGIYNGLLKFTNVKIPKGNLLGEEGRGLAMALGTINVGRLTLPAACTAAAKQCLQICRIWGDERIQWGLPVGQHEAGREKIAYIAATTMAMEAMSWLTGAWADKGNVDIRIEAAMAKLFCSEEIWKIVDMTMQLRGGRGYEKATSLKARGEPAIPVERMMRDARINTILEGSTEIMHLFLAREAMDPHLKMAGNLLKRDAGWWKKLKTTFSLMGFYALWYPKQLFGGLSGGKYADLGILETHYQFIHKESHYLARKIFGYMAKYRQKLEKKQLLLARLIENATDLFAMAAVCSFAVYKQKTLEGNPSSPLDVANYFCLLARRRIKERYALLDHNDDKVMNQQAVDILNNHVQWLEEGVIPLNWNASENKVEK